MTTTLDRQTTKHAERPERAEDRTAPRVAWSDVVQAPPVLHMMRRQEAAVEAETAAAGFRAAFSWAMKQDFPPDHAERLRESAWEREAE